MVVSACANKAKPPAQRCTRTCSDRRDAQTNEVSKRAKRAATKSRSGASARHSPSSVPRVHGAALEGFARPAQVAGHGGTVASAVHGPGWLACHRHSGALTKGLWTTGVEVMVLPQAGRTWGRCQPRQRPQGAERDVVLELAGLAAAAAPCEVRPRRAVCPHSGTIARRPMVRSRRSARCARTTAGPSHSVRSSRRRSVAWAFSPGERACACEAG